MGASRGTVEVASATLARAGPDPFCAFGAVPLGAAGPDAFAGAVLVALFVAFGGAKVTTAEPTFAVTVRAAVVPVRLLETRPPTTNADSATAARVPPRRRRCNRRARVLTASRLARFGSGGFGSSKSSNTGWVVPAMCFQAVTA